MVKGDTGVVKGFFCGSIAEHRLFPFPTFSAGESETLTMVLDSVNKFLSTKEGELKEFDASGHFSDEYVDALKELGLFGLIIPEEANGLGLSNSGYARVMQEVSYYDASSAVTIGAHSSIGMKGLLLFGTPEQKKKYLPRLATGEMVASFCLTEPGSGSDAASIKTRATKNSDGSWTLNGDKIWITNGSMAEFFTVFARTESEKGRLSAFIVERSFGGVAHGKKEDKLGIRASATTAITFTDVRIPAENLLGEEGDGFKIAMAILNNGRTGLGGGCIGAMKRCLALAAKQSVERKQFGKCIHEFALVKEKLAQMAVQTYAAESTVRFVAHFIDSGSDDYAVEAAISKIYATEALWSTAHEALQIAGGNGFMKEFLYERIVRDSRINLIFEGTNEILRLMVALGGAKEAGRVLGDLSRAPGRLLSSPGAAAKALGAYAGLKVRQYVPGMAPTLTKVAPELQGEAEIFSAYALELSKFTEHALKSHRKEIVNEQLTLKRLADVAIDLFVGMCVLSRVTASIQRVGKEKAAEEIRIAQLFAQQAKRRMSQNIRRISRNEDDRTKALADSVVKDGYRWDWL